MKNYEAPILEEQIVEIEDIIATSGQGQTGFGKWDIEENWGEK